MGKGQEKVKKSLVCVTSLVFAAMTLENAWAWPTADECSQGSGCISTANGGKVTFNFNASWDVDTQTQNGQLTFTDSNLIPGGLSLNSSTLIDYSVLSTTTREFGFDLSGTAYGQARVTVTDNGATGDTIQIQLVDPSGVPVYDTLTQTLSADCAGGITVGSCVVPSPCQLQVSAMCSSPNSTPSGSCAVAGSSGPIEFTYTVKNAGTTAVPLSSLTASDSFGSLDLSSLGSGSIAPGQSVSFSITETVTGPFPFVNTVTVTGGTGQCSDEASVTVQQTTPTPGTECDDFVTGGGWIVGTPTGAKGNFGVHGGLRNGKLWGGLNYLDHGTGLHVKSTGVTAYTVIGATCRRIGFNVTIDGKPGTAVVDVCDNGEPGRNDTFGITLSDGYKASGDLGGRRPGGGNIQLHKKNCNNGNGSKSANSKAATM
jgi:hypothetical protein